MAKDTSLTKPQLAAYWRAATAAAREVGESLEGYRKRVMSEECGVSSVKALNRTGDFDKVMCRFAVDSGDYAGAEKFATAGAERLVVLIAICAAQIMQLKGCPGGSSIIVEYIAGILRQAHIVSLPHADESLRAQARYWRIHNLYLDLPESSLLDAFKMLDTHRRRLLRDLAEPSSVLRFMGFDPAVVYWPLASGGVRIIYDGSYYSSFHAG